MIKRKLIRLVALLCLVIFWSMSSSSNEMADNTQVLRHVVALKFKEELSEERKAQAVQDFLALKDEIPGILTFEGGEDISVEGLTKGFTHCFILTFKDEAARDAYLPHPAHNRLVAKNKPLLADLLVLDFWGAK